MLQAFDAFKHSITKLSFESFQKILYRTYFSFQIFSDTQKYVVTFTTSQSYIEVPGWRKGDIAFSFRTTGEKAILLFQPPIRPNFPSFLVALTGDYQLTFAFTLNTGTSREMVINSNRKLNGGEWHKIWIDYNDYHVRFMINTDYQMVDLLAEEEFGPFEGSMYVDLHTFLKVPRLTSYI